MTSIYEALPIVEPPAQRDHGEQCICAEMVHQAPAPPHLINMLHHSASNSMSSKYGTPWETELRYPSGYSERFSLDSHTDARRKKSKRTLEPIDDIIRTAKTILLLTAGAAGLQKALCTRIQQAHDNRDLMLFKETMQSINTLLSSPLRLTQPSTDVIHHFFDQLYDRAVSLYASGLDRYDRKSTDNVYGELQPAFLSKVFKQVGLSKSSGYLDLGSGIGNTVMQAALETGCEAHGIEREAFANLVSAYHFQQFQIRAMLWGLHLGKTYLYFGDFLRSRLIDDLLRCVDVVLVNNFKFEPETDWNLYELLGTRLKAGARVVSTKPLMMAKRREGKGVRSTGLTFNTKSYTYQADSVSWSGSTGTYYIATKLHTAR